MVFKEEQQPALSTHGNLITILSIDGGGVKGIIPSVFLERLETELQRLDGEHVRLADYFDVIAGAGTSSLMTAMLATPNEHNRPRFAAKDVKDFYLQHYPKIFPYRNRALKMIQTLCGPKYDGKYLHKVLGENLQGKRLHDTLTNIVIPTFDTICSKLAIFSSYELQNDHSLDAKLSDICIGSSATPTYLFSDCFHKFHTTDSKGNILREFELVHIGVSSNNPTMLAIGEVFKDIKRRNLDSAEYSRLLVISLGTGEEDHQKKYDSKKSSCWDILGWLDRKLYDLTSWVDVATHATDDMVDLLALQAVGFEENYLRIQDDISTGNITMVDIATKTNLENLVKLGEDLLKKPVTRMNKNAGLREPCHHSSNEKALKQFALKLHEEKKARELRSPSTNRGQV